MANKLLISSSFYNDAGSFEVFKWTAGSIFKSESAKSKLAKNINKMILKQKLFCII